MSPILVRPVREQLEHDRIIRLLPGKYKRKFEVGINPGAEQNAGIGAGVKATYPDAVLYSMERSRRIEGVVEVETGESINHLEAMAQWAAYGRLRVPFHLYVPIGAVDMARRLALDHDVVGDRNLDVRQHRGPGALHAGPQGSRSSTADCRYASDRDSAPGPGGSPRARPLPPSGQRPNLLLRLRARLRPPRPRVLPVVKKPARAAAPRRAAPARPAPKVAAKRAKAAPSRKTAARKAPAAKRR